MSPTSARSRTRVALLLAPLVLAAACSAAAIAIGVLGWSRAAGVHDELDRIRGGQATVIDVPTPGRQTVWSRHHDYAGAEPATLTVTLDGEPVATSPLPGDATYEVGSSAITAIWAFDADRPGEYVVTATDADRSAQFLVGPDDPVARHTAGTRWVVRGAVGFALTLAAAVILLVIRGLRARSATRDRPPPVAP